MIMPRDQLKLSTIIDGKDSIAAFIAETLNVEVKDNIIDFSSNEEFVKLYDEYNNMK